MGISWVYKVRRYTQETNIDMQVHGFYLFEMICKLWIFNAYVYWRMPMGFFTTVYGILSWGTVIISNHYLSFLYWRGTNVILCKVEPQFVS